MFLKSIAVAAIAAASLSLSACNSTSAQIDSAFANAQALFTAAKSVVSADAQAGIIDAVTAKKIDAYITAGDQALSGAQAAFTAGDAKTEQDKVAAVLAAVTDINGAVLTAVAAYSSR